MDGMHWMAGAMEVARHRLETATHNLANAGTDGFRTAQTRVRLDERAGLSATSVAAGERGALRWTGRPFDLALAGPGVLRVAGGSVRGGAFVRERDGTFTDPHGRALLGAHGPLHAPATATFGSDGTVRDGERVVDRVALPRGTTLHAGALEASGTDTIASTLEILEAQRAFETAQHVFVAIDETREKAAGDVGRLR